MGNIGIGANSTLLVDFEDTWGVTPTPAAKKIPFIEESLKGDQDLIDNPCLASDPNPLDPVVGKQDAGGGLSTVPTVVTAPWLLKMALGAPTTTGSGPYTHTFKLASGALPSVVAEVMADLDTDQYKLVNGLVVNSLKFDVGADGFLKFSFDLKGKKVTWSASAGLASGSTDWTTSQTFFDHMMLTSALVKEGGSAIAQLVSLSCSIDHNLAADDYRIGGSGYRGSIVRKPAKVTGTARLSFEDLTFINKGINGTWTSFDLTWTSGANTLQLFIPRVRLKRTDPTVNDGGPLFVDVNWTASKDGTEATAFKAVVVNSSAGTLYA